METVAKTLHRVNRPLGLPLDGLEMVLVALGLISLRAEIILDRFSFSVFDSGSDGFGEVTEVVLICGTEWRLGYGGFWVRLRRQFLLGCLGSIDLVGRAAAQDRVGEKMEVLFMPSSSSHHPG
jgi:hypothetical protein